jgi:hypothetical protein
MVYVLLSELAMNTKIIAFVREQYSKPANPYVIYLYHLWNYFIFFTAVASISLIRLSWLTSLAPGS